MSFAGGLIDDGALTGIPGFTFVGENFGTEDISYSSDGPFLGASYGVNFANKGRFSINLALAYMNGKLSNDSGGGFVDYITGDIYAFPISSTSGNSIGASIGLSWIGEISSYLNYYVNINGYNYSFDSDAEGAPDFTERLMGMTFGLSYLL